MSKSNEIMVNNVADVRAIIESAIPTIEMLPFRAPAKFDGCNVPHFGFFNVNDGSCLQSFTAQSGYEQTTTDDYVALAEAGIAAMGGQASIVAKWTQTKSIAKATIIVQPSEQDRLRMYDIGEGDTIWPRLIISAPFGRRFTVDGGFYRDACRNLARFREVQGVVSVSLSHTSQLRGRLDQLIGTMQRADNFETIAARMQQLNEVQVNTADFLARLYPIESDASANTRTRAENRASKIYSRIMAERIKLGVGGRDSQRSTLWELVQGVTGYIQWDKTRKNGQTDDLTRAVAALDDTETTEAWQSVLSFAS